MKIATAVSIGQLETSIVDNSVSFQDRYSMPDPKLVLESKGGSQRRASLIQPIIRGILLALILLLVVSEADVRFPRLTFPLITQAASAFLFSVAAHELGHLAGGKLNGMSPLVFAVWPIRLDRRNARWRVTWLHRSRLSGFVVMDPGTQKHLARRMFVMVAAGPFCSLAASIASIGLTMGATASWPAWLIGELKVISLWSILIAVLGFVPIPSRYSVNDGMRLLMLLRNGKQAERFCCLALLAPCMLGRSRPKEWERDLVDRLPGPLDGSLDAMSAQAIRYNVLLDCGEIDQADRILEWLVVQRLPGEARIIWRLEAAWMQAKFRGDLPGARQWLDASGTRVKTPDGRCALWKAKAAVAFLEQHWSDAEDAIRQAVEASKRMSDNGIAQVIREELENLGKSVELKRQQQDPIAT